MEGFDIREPWREGKILIKRTEFINAKTDLMSSEGFGSVDAGIVTRLHVEDSVSIADAAINKMIKGE
jgi:hypothetical protein